MEVAQCQFPVTAFPAQASGAKLTATVTYHIELRGVMAIRSVVNEGSCRKGIYKSNSVVRHSPLVCGGGFGQKPCIHLATCAQENGMRLKNRRDRRSR